MGVTLVIETQSVVQISKESIGLIVSRFLPHQSLKKNNPTAPTWVR